GGALTKGRFFSVFWLRHVIGKHISINTHINTFLCESKMTNYILDHENKIIKHYFFIFNIYQSTPRLGGVVPRHIITTSLEGMFMLNYDHIFLQIVEARAFGVLQSRLHYHAQYQSEICLELTK
ncbi:hypothetical protein ACJX0J_012828, partial [Zea mays]